ncbi:MAG: hypothetical protein N3F67_04340 [Acidilobaceae archaeon]|nr:hypothetical protein [Acidilobaceae archaeon]
MPRVEGGQKVVESLHVLRLSYEELRELKEWAISQRAVLVTAPSLVYVKPGILLAVGVGSIISHERPPVGSYYEVLRTAWVDGCKVGEREPSYKRAEGRAVRAEGVVVAIDHRDPVALFVNGSSGLHEIVEGEKAGAIAVVAGRPAVLKLKWYISLLLSGEGHRRTEYIAPLVSSCSRGEEGVEA